MVRRCVIPGCSSTDQTTLVHRFPRKHCKTWQNCLLLNSYPINDLLEKYVVCAHHFRITDYRHKESKHLNSTAIPTLNIIPDDEKILEIQSGNLKGNKRTTIKNITNIQTDTIMQNLNSNLTAGKTQIYSNCFTLSSSIPTEIVNSNHSVSDNENHQQHFKHFDPIEEEHYLDEGMLLDPDLSDDSSHGKELLNCETITEYLNDDTFTDNITFIGDKGSNCDNNTDSIIEDTLTNYVELIEANDDTDEECLPHISDRSVISSQLTEMYKNLSRNDLIDQLVVATNRIKELETKLANVQKAHVSMLQNLNNLNKVLIS